MAASLVWIMTSCTNSTPAATSGSSVSAVAPSVGPPATTAPPACSWSVVRSPNAGPEGAFSFLSDLAVVSNTDIWAIGRWYFDQEGGPERSIVEHWNGTRWALVRVPGLGPRDILLDVAAASATDVWAVGFSGNHGLTLHWNGERWAEVPAADPGTRYWHFTGAAAETQNEAWVVGNTATGRSGTALLERWDGQRWSVVPSPSVEPDLVTALPYAGLEAVTGIPGGDLWAVGDALNVGGGPSNSLVERWDGERWTVTPSPDVPKRNGLTFDHLFAVSAASPTEAWAVGTFGRGAGIGGGGDHAFIQRWDGRHWTMSAIWTRDQSRLSGVATAATGDAWAVGSIGVQRRSLPLIRHWDGQRWSPVETHAPRGASLWDVAVTPSGDVWAVGSVVARRSQKTLAMRCDATR